MKYWKGIGKKAGMFGTMDDSGSVPDSEVATKAEYDSYAASFPVVDLDKIAYSKLLNDEQRLVYIAKKMGLL